MHVRIFTIQCQMCTEYPRASFASAIKSYQEVENGYFRHVRMYVSKYLQKGTSTASSRYHYHHLALSEIKWRSSSEEEEQRSTFFSGVRMRCSSTSGRSSKRLPRPVQTQWCGSGRFPWTPQSQFMSASQWRRGVKTTATRAAWQGCRRDGGGGGAEEE